MTERRLVSQFETCPRYDKHELSEAQIIEIAKKAVLLAREDFYADVGKSITNKFFWAVGLSIVSFMGWMTAHGYIK